MPKIDEQNNNYENDSLHYPDDLGVGFTHPDCVKFTIGTNPGVSLAPLTDKVKNLAKVGQTTKLNDLINEQAVLTQGQDETEIAFNQRLEDLTSKITEIGKRITNNRDTTRPLQITAGDALSAAEAGLKGGYKTLKDFGQAIRKGQEQNKFTFLNSIYLPMPENLVYNEPIDWQGTDLGMMKGAADALLGKGGSDNALGGAALSQAGNVLAGGAGAIVSKLLGGGLLGGAVLGGLGGGAGVQGAIESNLRIKSNPFKEQTFQGVGFRPFEFSFIFNARSQSEVNMIRKIVNSFRKYSKPSLDKPDSAIFSYPAEFQIEFLTKDEYDNFNENTYLPRLKRCVCKSVNTNFTTAGWKSFNDGAPTTITLQLGFEETDIITSEQVDKTGDFGEKGGF